MKEIILAVFIAWTNNGYYTKDSKGVLIFYDIEKCEKKIKAFALKHKIKKEKCVKLPSVKYQKSLANKTVTFLIGKDTPICGGHECKKNRKGKLYACTAYKDRCK